MTKEEFIKFAMERLPNPNKHVMRQLGLIYDALVREGVFSTEDKKKVDEI